MVFGKGSRRHHSSNRRSAQPSPVPCPGLAQSSQALSGNGSRLQLMGKRLGPPKQIPNVVSKQASVGVVLTTCLLDSGKAFAPSFPGRLLISVSCLRSPDGSSGWFKAKPARRGFCVRHFQLEHHRSPSYFQAMR